MNRSIAASGAFDLSGRVALVTGAGSGLGRHFATVLANAGATVALCARRIDKLEETAGIIHNSGGRAVCVALDVTRAESIRSSFDEIASQAGVPQVLVNNAGVNRPAFATDMSEEDWDAVIDTNLRGCFLMAKEFASRLIAAASAGSLINVASILALRTQKSVSAYMAAKAGLVHMGKGFALEWAGYGIRVNTLVPGYFNTDLTAKFLQSDPGRELVANIPMRRGGELEELTAPLLLLAGDASSFMTGSTLVVDGGHLVSSP